MIDALLGTPVAKGSVESLYAEHGRDLPWPYWLLWLMVIAAVVVNSAQRRIKSLKQMKPARR